MAEPPPRKKRVKPANYDIFAAAEYKIFRETAAGKEHNQPVRQFLDSLRGRRWGFVTYRTVPGPDAEAQVQAAIAKLNAVVKKEVEGNLSDAELDRSVNEKVWARWRGAMVEVMGNEEEPVGIDEVRAVFLEMTRGGDVGGRGMRDVCILLDKEGAKRLIDADVNGEERLVSNGGTYVAVVDGSWVSGEGDPEYPGWMKVNVRSLMRLFDVLGTMSLNDNWSILSERDKDGVFIYEG
ncbi:hypothetical protein IFR05_006575 [Cadophora sp. M221]|nr:hypothetical protein IFR05_006575 [Cadophora sp. M221]